MPNSDRWKEIAFSDFNCDAFRIWKEEHLVLAAGDFAANEYNAMAVGGGFLGFLWGVPAVMVLVRPQRRTFELLERYDTFTLSVFDSRYRDAVAELGAVSGRDVPDKLAAAGFTAVEAGRVEAPAIAEAELVIECRKTCRAALHGRDFCDKSLIESRYPGRDYHSCFFGRVLRIAGGDKYWNAEALLEHYGRH